MGLLKGLTSGVIAGLVGAAVWAGIAHGTGYEIGWIAWGIGAFVGFAVARGGKGGMQAGVLAVVISVLAIMGGKYAAVELALNQELGNEAQFIEEALANLENDEFVVSFLADEIATDREAQGEEIAWPRGVVSDEAEKESDYPPEIWSEASSRWDQMSQEDRRTYRTELGDNTRAYIEESFAAIRSTMLKELFLHSFGVLDIVFILLAVITAFRIAAAGGTGGAEGDENEDIGWADGDASP